MHKTDFGDILPALKSVAAFAVRPERAVVDVFMASFAFFGCAREFQRSVTFFAFHRGMLALQREAGLLMPEFEIEPQRRPGFGAVAITARDLDFTVRVVHGGNLRVGRFVQFDDCEKHGAERMAPGAS
jgi:hypothetical protein